MRVYVAVALLLTAALAGCSDKKKDADTGADADDASSGGTALPTLLLTLKVGNATYDFSTAKAGSATGHSVHHNSTSASTTSGNATGTAGNGTRAAGNATGNATMPTGEAPLDVTFELGAKNLANGTVYTWTLDFGDRASGNATGNSSMNATQVTGSKLPGAANHTYMAAGDYNVTYVLLAANKTVDSLKATLHVDAVNGTATVTKALPAVTHFEFGESWGCDGSSGTPACIDFLNGPPGNDIDGHWIELGEPYWGLALTSTVDQGGLVLADSDCVFTDADVGIIGEANNGSGPCTGTVPEGAAWLFVYPYGIGALGMTVDFGLAAAA